LQLSCIALTTHFLHGKLDCWSVHSWLRSVGDGGQESGRDTATPHWVFSYGKRGRGHSDKKVSALNICLGCCVSWARSFHLP